MERQETEIKEQGINVGSFLPFILIVTIGVCAFLTAVCFYLALGGQVILVEPRRFIAIVEVAGFVTVAIIAGRMLWEIWKGG